MMQQVAVPSRPAWANERTAVVATAELVGPVAERGDRLYASLLDLLEMSLVKTLGDLRARAASNIHLDTFLEVYEENQALDLEESDEDADLYPRADVRSELLEWYADYLSAPWIVEGGTGWELDEVVARFGRVWGSSPGGHADWVQFSIDIDELAHHLRDLGFETVRVPSLVFEQFFGIPDGGIWLDEGEPLPGPSDGNR